MVVFLCDGNASSSSPMRSLTDRRANIRNHVDLRRPRTLPDGYKTSQRARQCPGVYDGRPLFR